MERSTNALAELAEQIKRERNALAFYRSEYSPVLDKAQRIVAELAKVEFRSQFSIEPIDEPDIVDCVEAVTNCRAIAEEGVKDGK